nr:hypothetical protein Iba_chr03cCG5480 [Ipomoea batatas]
MAVKSASISSPERAIENLLFCNCAKLTTFPFLSLARRVHKVHGKAATSCPKISHQLLADNLDIIVATDGGFNQGNLLHLIATVVLLGVITRRIVELYPTGEFLAFDYINLLLNSSEPILGFSGWFGIAGRVSKVLGQAAAGLESSSSPKGFLSPLLTTSGLPFPSVHGSCPEINHLLADSLDIIIATDGDF